MASAGMIVEFVFKALGWVPAERTAVVTEAHVTMNYTTILNLVFLGLAGVLVWRAGSTDGFRMPSMMRASAGSHSRH